MHTHRLWLPLLASLVIALAGCSDSETGKTRDSSEASSEDFPVTWRFALEEIEGSVQHAYAQALKTRIEANSDGRIIVDVFPYGSLGTSSQLTELVRNGSVNMAFASPGHLSDSVPETGVFLLHFLVPDNDDVARRLFTDPSLTELFAPAYQDGNLTLLGFVPEGWMAWTANKPLRTPGDFRGMRFRTMTSDMSAEAFRAYGADTVKTPYSKVYSELQLRQLDGQTNPVFAIEEMNFYEVQSTMTQARATQFVSSVVANPDWYEGLPARQQEWLEQSIRELGKQAWDIQKDLNQTRLEAITTDGKIRIVTLTDDERATFRQASQPTYQYYLEQNGARGEQILSTIRGMVETLAGTPESDGAGNTDGN
ncbi:MAG: TRAP transporter substrate-binding protein DctP [Marinobacter sp.]|nr:TRAP transporter substrate-binding protein DctP [Marinobacter sp.]